MRGYVFPAVVAVFFLCALSAVGAAKTEAKQEELVVSAAASLTHAFGEIGSTFEKANPGSRVVFNFGASGALLQQIDKGAPVDILASADQKTMDQAREKQLIRPDTRKDFVSNRLVLVVPVQSKSSLVAVQDLTGPQFARVSLGNPETVPAGRFARQVLTHAGLWETLQPKLIPGESVRQVLDYVSRGEVDAGFVFETDAAIAGDRVKVVSVLDQHDSILYPIAVVATSRKPELAQRFIEFVLSEEGQAILSGYGFGNPRLKGVALSSVQLNSVQPALAQ